MSKKSNPVVREEEFEEVTEVGKSGLLSSAAAITEFALAGNARITLVSKKTKVRYTYRVATAKGKTDPHFVSVLYGEDNVGDYAYLGTIFADGKYAHGRKSSISADDIRDMAFRWMWAKVSAGNLPADLEVWHEGRCGRCGRLLTVPESIERGIGPELAGKMAMVF